MKAIVYERYGSFDDLEMRDIAKPIIEADEVLVRMRAAGGRPFVIAGVLVFLHVPRTYEHGRLGE
jgi:NADPH:quinone reductase-like Zn-dependent oxidoreductase